MSEGARKPPQFNRLKPFEVGVCWNSNPEDVTEGSVNESFALLKPWLRNAHINELWKTEYPWRELFGFWLELCRG